MQSLRPISNLRIWASVVWTQNLARYSVVHSLLVYFLLDLSRNLASNMSKVSDLPQVLIDQLICIDDIFQVSSFTVHLERGKLLLPDKLEKC